MRTLLRGPDVQCRYEGSWDPAAASPAAGDSRPARCVGHHARAPRPQHRLGVHDAPVRRGPAVNPIEYEQLLGDQQRLAQIQDQRARAVIVVSARPPTPANPLPSSDLLPLLDTAGSEGLADHQTVPQAAAPRTCTGTVPALAGHPAHRTDDTMAVIQHLCWVRSGVAAHRVSKMGATTPSTRAIAT